MTRKHAKRTKKVGRPKGSKTKRRKGGKTRKKATPKKRDPKSAWNDGVAFFVGDEANFLDIRWHDGNGMESKEVVQRILWVAFMIFGGKSIVSNHIESFNRELKHAIPKEGMHIEAHILNRITRAIQLKNRTQIVAKLAQRMPVSPKIGVLNLQKFMRADPNKIVLRKEVLTN